MLFQINAKLLANTLKESKLSADTKARSNKTSHFVEIQAVDGNVIFSTATEDTALQLCIDVRESINGSVIVNLKDLQETVKAFESGSFLTLFGNELEDGSKELEISAAGTVARLPHHAIELYNKLNDSRGEHKANLSKEQVNRIIDRLLFAVASYDQSSILGGVNLKLADGQLLACATDGSRLTSMDEIHSNLADNLNATIPGEAFKALAGLLKNKDRSNHSDSLSITQDDEKTLTFTFWNTTFKTRIIAGEYPRYAELFPVEFKTVLEFNIEQFSKTVKAAAKCADERTNLVKVTLNGACVVEASIPDGQAYKGEIPYSQPGYEHIDANFACNVRYLSDVLDAAVGNTVQIGYQGPLKPLIFMDSESRTKHLLMPVQAK